MRIVSVNRGVPRASRHADLGVTGIDKRPVAGPVELRDPGPRGVGGSGVAGDVVCDLSCHGGTGQAVYAYASEDLDAWAAEVGRRFAPGTFGENLTTAGVDVTGALAGERWLVGATCVLQVTTPRIPCRTFAGWLEDAGWVRRFTQHGAPGAYLRVVEPGPVQAGDPVRVVAQPDHDVTIGLMFAALTTDKSLLPRLLAAGDDLWPDVRDRVLARRRSA